MLTLAVMKETFHTAKMFPLCYRPIEIHFKRFGLKPYPAYNARVSESLREFKIGDTNVTQCTAARALNFASTLGLEMATGAVNLRQT